MNGVDRSQKLFDDAVALLDRKLGDASTALKNAHIVVRDRSNISGAKGDFPWWECSFERRQERGVEFAACRLNVVVTYPIAESCDVSVRRQAEVFHIGQTSRIVREQTEVLSLEEFLRVDLTDFVASRIEAGLLAVDPLPDDSAQP